MKYQNLPVYCHQKVEMNRVQVNLSVCYVINCLPLIFFSSQRAVTTALWCNFLVFSLKFGVYLVTSSHVMLAELVHSVADFANQVAFDFNHSICIMCGSLWMRATKNPLWNQTHYYGIENKSMKTRSKFSVAKFLSFILLFLCI